MKKIINLAYCFFLIAFSNSDRFYCQTSTNTSIYDWFDNTVGKENLALNNGKLFLNYDKTLENTNRFLFDDFKNGSVYYDGQIYNDLLLNYDIYKDELILKPNNVSEKTAIIVIKENVDYFIINKIKYMNFFQNNDDKGLNSGYWEELFFGNYIKSYTKHIKNRIDLINNDKLYDDFIYSNNFAIIYKNTTYNISSKKSVTNLFPNFKKDINEFYSTNNYLEKNDKSKFFANLFEYINSLVKN